MEIFEIKEKDVGARIGKLRTKSGELETPAFFPVLNPHFPLVHPKDLQKVGFNSLITNAYSLYKDEKLRKKVLKEGIHEAYNWESIIATDSGAFQLWQYKDFEVTNLEICKFQKKIGTDLGVILDVPTGKSGKTRKKQAIKTTIKRGEKIEQSGLLKGGETIFLGPLHGTPHLDLLRYSLEKMTAIPFKMFSVGSIVPLMENYRYLPLLKSLSFIKRNIPTNYPLHLFGAGHPIALALLTLLGFDTFDSASYAKFARKNRYMTSRGSSKLKNLRYLPCKCPVCSSWSSKELLELNEAKRKHYLALHNLYVIKREINTIKQAIQEGRLWKLVASRVDSHPALARAYRWMLMESEESTRYFTKFDPVYKKRGLLLTRREEFHHPQILRYKQRIKERKYIWADKAIITERKGALELPERVNAQVFLIDSPFGIIPREIQEVYPLFQHETFTEETSQENLSFISNFIEQLKHREVGKFFWYKIKRKFRELLEELGVTEEYKGKDVGILPEKTVLKHKIKAMLRYQFGPGAEKTVRKISVQKSRKTERIRRIFAEKDRITNNEIEEIIKPEIKEKKRTGKEISTNEVREVLNEKKERMLGSLVPQNYKIVPQPLLAWRLKKQLDGKYSVTVDKEAEPFVRDGKSIFAKFVLDADEAIKANDEVLVLSREGNLIANGRAVLGGKEMLEFKRGVAVENRWGRQKRS